MTELNAERARQAIVEHTRRLTESAAAAEPDAPVPTTPEWTLADLVEHVGQTQHWTAQIIERRITDPAQLPTEVAALPADPRDWREWLSESAQRVASAFSDDALAAPVFNPAGDERPGARFWLINVLNETIVHGFDGARAAGRASGGTSDGAADTGMDGDVGSALISHHLAMLTSPTWEMLRPESAHAIRGTGQTLQWLATDTADGVGAWFVERRPDGATWQPGTQPADVTVTGPAGALLLTLTRRLPLAAGDAAGVSIDGETDLVRHWLDNTAHVAD
ncbi:maleylpyruvate isomerase N-terminal domain-containing protein [Promicromonospora sp. NPDC050249]|uniref:maleylpyruvate isomerase N-terminal domain-containing protein n=1 Tax=Promicromonospora sp. NPDC050249 TaxID=3154743 RepID=UPI0033C0161E